MIPAKIDAVKELKFERTGPDSWTVCGLIVYRMKSRGFGKYYQLFAPIEKFHGDDVLGQQLGEGKTLQAIRGQIAHALEVVKAMKV